MMRFMFLSPIYMVLRVCLGLVFIYSGLAKCMDLFFFSKIIQAFVITPNSFSLSAAFMIVLAVTGYLYLWRHKTGHCPVPVFPNESKRK